METDTLLDKGRKTLTGGISALGAAEKRLESAIAAEAAALGLEEKPQSRAKSLAYDPHVLATWRTFLMFRGTVFFDPAIWWTVAKLIAVAVASGGLLFLSVPAPEKLNTRTFHDAVNFIKVFIAFMLGLFLNSCLARWYNILASVTDLFLCIKKVVWTLNSIGVQEDLKGRVQKLMVLSCYLLEGEVSNQWETDPVVLRKAWEETCYVASQKGVLSPGQKRVLESKVHSSHRALGVWSWVGTIMRQLSGPGVSPPMTARLAAECAEAIEQMKKIKTFATLQLPFMYSHMLAFLVQMNNILLAIACGFSCAVRVGDALHSAKGGSMSSVYHSAQGLILEIFVVIIEPVLYQAFLIIASTLADPFTHDQYGLPMLEYIDELSEQLNEMNTFAAHPTDLNPPVPLITPAVDSPKGEQAV